MGFIVKDILPRQVIVCEGEVFKLQLDALPWPQPSVCWQVLDKFTHEWKTISNQPCLKLRAKRSMNGNKYRALVNGCECYLTNSVKLCVNFIDIIEQPQDASVNPLFLPTNVSFTSMTIGKLDPVRIQWQVNSGNKWVNLINETSNTLAVTITESNLNNQYRAVFRNGCLEVSRSAKLLLPRVAVLGADNQVDLMDVQAKILGTGLVSLVDIIDVNVGQPVPTLDQLLKYDSVLLYSDSDFNDNIVLGNLLADYSDLGKGVVISAISYIDNDAGIMGRLLSDGYLPFTQGSTTTTFQLTLVPIIPNSLLLKNVSVFNGGSLSLRNDVGLTTGATLIAEWSTGQPLVGTKETPGRVVGLNFFPPSSTVNPPLWLANTDGAQLMANALLWSFGP